jgi:outer membrane protein TolC/ABC-type uncharacterized transport system substrate-binding protein
MGEQEQFQKEIRDLIGAEHTVEFPEQKSFGGEWNPETIKKHFESLMKDKDVDIVIAMGGISSNIAIQQESFSKPVIAPFVFDRNLQNAPFKKGGSGVHNLNYLDVPNSIERDILYFKEMTGFKHLVFLVNGFIFKINGHLPEKVKEMAQKCDCRIKVIPVGESVDSALNILPKDADAVYITPLLHLKSGEFDKLIKGLNDRKLPSFSFIGEREVEKGTLVSLNPDPCTRITRRIGVNIQRILMGDDPAIFPVHYSIGERLTFNIETARAIGFEPAWHIYNQAHFVGKVRPKKGRELTIKKAVEEAVERNLDLSAGKHETASVKQEVLAAKSKLMPSFELGSSALAVEEEVAEAAMGAQPQYSAKATATVSQVLFSEQTNMNVSVQKHIYAAQQDQFEQLKLDVTMDVVEAYYNVLRAQTFERIRRENVKRSRRYLELARIRVSVGSANQSEVYRWESQIASNLKDLISANSQRNLAEMQLNRLLNMPQESSFQLKEQNSAYNDLLTPWDHYNRCFNTKSTFRAFREFMVSEALKNSPEIKALDETIAIQKRMLRAANRAFWAPTIAAYGQMDNTFYKDGAGTEYMVPNPPDDVNWILGASLTFPIYTGAEIFAKRKGHSEAMLQKELERKSAVDGIEQRIRSHLHEAGASFAGFNQAVKAAEAAEKGLDMVKDAYAQGVVSIVTLIDAQTQAQIAQEAATDILFDYLLKLMQVQRGVGQYDFFRSPKENKDFKSRLAQSIEKKVALNIKEK